MIERIKNTVSWFLSHKAWAGIGGLCAVIGLLISLLSFLNHHDTNKNVVAPPLVQPRPNNPSCIEEPIQVVPQNDKLNLSRSLSYLSGCYVDGCYTYQLTITDLVETDISNQFLKGLDWHVGLSVSERKAGGRTHSTVIKIRSNGRSLDEIRNKSAFKLDEKVYVWLDSLNICNKEKRK